MIFKIPKHKKTKTKTKKKKKIKIINQIKRVLTAYLMDGSSSASIGSDSTVMTTWSGAEDSSTPPLKRTPPKKVVTSKIASLWKQVEESRTKQKMEQPDVRKWISRGDCVKTTTEDKVVGTTAPKKYANISRLLNQKVVYNFHKNKQKKKENLLIADLIL